MDARLVDGEACATREAAFEAGKILFWPDLPLPQLTALQALPTIPNVKLRKMNLAFMERHQRATAEPWKYWVGSDGEARRVFREVFVAARDWLRAFVASRFRYRFAGGIQTWRFVETRGMAPHWDNYADHVKLLGLRLFLNVDTLPRVWAFGPDLLDYAAANYERLKLHQHRTLSQIAYACTVGLEQPDWPRFEIPPGGMLILHSQRVGHQVVFGRRLVAFSFGLPTGQLLDPGSSPDGLARRIHEAAGHA